MSRHWRLVVTVAAVAVFVGALIAVSESPRYRSSAKLLYTGAAASASATAPEDPVRALDTIVRLAQTRDVISLASRRAGVPFAVLQQSTSVAADPSADILTISASASSADRARTFAQSLAEGLVNWERRRQGSLLRSRIAALKRQIADLERSGAATQGVAAAAVGGQLVEAQAELNTQQPYVMIVSDATTPTSASSPRPFRTTVLALLGGLIIGLAAAAARDRFSGRFASVDQLAEVVGAPVLGVVPRGVRGRSRGDYGHAEPIADAVRSVRSNLALRYRSHRRSPVLVVASALECEGAGVLLTANLAQAFASGGTRVLVVDADLRRPLLEDEFDRVDDNRSSTADGFVVGLVEVLEGSAGLADATVLARLRGTSDAATVALLAGGHRTVADPGSLFGSSALAALIDSARDTFDVVLFAGPPLLEGSEAFLVAAYADDVLLATRLGVITRRDAVVLRRSLERLDVEIGGIVEVAGTGIHAERTTPAAIAALKHRIGRLAEARPVRGGTLRGGDTAD